jgi:hypothetical protein
MTTGDFAAQRGDDLMAQVALRLDCAALFAWEHAESVGPDSPLHGLGLGIYLARGKVAQLLAGEGHVESLGHMDGFEHLNQHSVVELLADVECLIGSRTDRIFSGLSVELCDLIREARALGC